MNREQAAQMIDHTLLKAFVSQTEFDQVIKECRDHHFKMLAINSAPVAYCKDKLKDTDIHVGAAISFPLGQTPLPVKLKEVSQAISDGADEIDYVINIVELKNKNYAYLKQEMKEITELCRNHRVLCKVIFENCYLEKEEIVRMSEIAREIKPDFIKTSTGFGTGGALAEDVRLMKETAGADIKVKAAGGIRDLDTFIAMVEAGAERIGTSSGVSILQELDRRLKEGSCNG